MLITANCSLETFLAMSYPTFSLNAVKFTLEITPKVDIFPSLSSFEKKETYDIYMVKHPQNIFPSYGRILANTCVNMQRCIRYCNWILNTNEITVCTSLSLGQSLHGFTQRPMHDRVLLFHFECELIV